MKEEIKEILEELEDCKITKYLNYNLDNKDARIILDYITNLQEENEMLNNECDTYMKIATKKQERIDKAIEYMVICGETNDAGYYQQFKDYEEYNKLLNILQGEDK